jgi:hypothetical protein
MLCSGYPLVCDQLDVEISVTDRLCSLFSQLKNTEDEAAQLRGPNIVSAVPYQ